MTEIIEVKATEIRDIKPLEIDSNLLENRQELNEEMILDYLAYLDVSEKTEITYLRNLKQFFGYLRLARISRPTRQDLLDWKEDLLRRCKPSTVQSYIVSIKLFFKYLEYKGIYPNIAQNLKGVRLEKGFKKDYLTKTQIKALLSNIDRTTLNGKRDYTILLLMLIGGLRVIEVSRANIGDLTTKSGKTILYLQGKGRLEKVDFIVIPLVLEEAIRDYTKATGRTLDEEEEPIFISTSNNSKGKRLTTRSISGTVKKALREIGLDSKRLTAHSLRHTAITLSLLQGRNIQEVQQFARHSNINTTQIYAHNIDRMQGNCENTIANLII